VNHPFGYPGGAIPPAYDALKHRTIRHLLVRQEQRPFVVASKKNILLPCNI